MRKPKPTLTQEQAWGRDALMVTAAFRYCLGRMTYIVSDCTDWLMQVWPVLPERAKVIIRRDLAEAIEADDRDRADGSSYKRLGHDCDRREWVALHNLIKESSDAG